MIWYPPSRSHDSKILNRYYSTTIIATINTTRQQITQAYLVFDVNLIPHLGQNFFLILNPRNSPHIYSFLLSGITSFLQETQYFVFSSLNLTSLTIFMDICSQTLFQFNINLKVISFSIPSRNLLLFFCFFLGIHFHHIIEFHQC